MKKLLMFMCICLFLFSCSNSTVDQLKSIRREFKQDVSVCILPTAGEFIVKDEDDGSWFVMFQHESMIIGLPPISIKRKIQFEVDIKQEIEKVIEDKERIY